ncbi:MAG TPA: hypothetical protein PKL29_09580 [Methanothrix sp.]|nr:hypothetical protein [Methanothrix sp.]
MTAWPTVLADGDLAGQPAAAITEFQSGENAGFKADGSGDGPILQISEIRGSFERGQPASIFVVLKNNQTPSRIADKSGLDRADARSIRAELRSADDSIKILSGTQMAGLLIPGENVTLQFAALAEGVPPGIYSFHILLNYSWLAQVTASNEGGAPNLVFSYDMRTMDLPIQAEVMREQGIELSVSEEDLFSKISSKKDGTLRLVLTNQGEQTVENLSLMARPVYPFMMIENSPQLLSIAPKESAEMSLMAFADENATPGYYALPCSITYESMTVDRTKVMRSREGSVIVYVGERDYPAWLYLGVAAGLSVLLVGGWWVRTEILRGRRRGRMRIVKG